MLTCISLFESTGYLSVIIGFMNNITPIKNPGKLDMMRIDLQDSLRKSQIDPQNLSSFQRILLTTDGTVTDILEAQLWEGIQIVKLYQEQITTETLIPYLDVGVNTEILARKVLLQGKESSSNYVYAESIIVPERLGEKICNGLLEAKKPLGLLINEERLETYREILSCDLEKAEEVAEHFDVTPNSNLVSRTYRVFAHQQPVMLITEKFPETAFK